MDLRLSLQALRKPASSRRDQRLFRLRFMPLPHGSKGGIPTALEVRGYRSSDLGHFGIRSDEFSLRGYIAIKTQANRMCNP
jgi:hypothetical protein